MSIKKFSDALALIQRATDSVESCKKNKDSETYCAVLTDLVGKFQNQISRDFALPVEYLEPIDPQLAQECEAENVDLVTEDFELTPEAQDLYNDLEISI